MEDDGEPIDRKIDRWIHKFFALEEYKEPDNSVFVDRRVLNRAWIPDELPFQYENLKLLEDKFKHIFEYPPKPVQLIIRGPQCSGKSVLTKFFFRWMTHNAPPDSKLKFVWIGSYEASSTFNIIWELFDKLKIDTAIPRGRSLQILISILHDFIEINNFTVVVAIHRSINLDNFFEETSRLNGIISFVFLGSNLPFLTKRIKDNLDCLLEINLKDYTPIELTTILQDRINFAFKPDIVSKKMLDFVVSQVIRGGTHSHRGVALASELLFYAGLILDRSTDQNPKATTAILCEKHIRRALWEITGFDLDESEEERLISE